MSEHALLDKAVAVCGSRYKLAKRLHVSEQHLSRVHLGRVIPSPALAAKLAAVAGIDPVHAAVAAIIEGEKDSQERARLTTLFFPAGTAAMLLFFIVAVLVGPWLTTGAPELTSLAALATFIKAPQSLYYVYS